MNNFSTNILKNKMPNNRSERKSQKSCFNYPQCDLHDFLYYKFMFLITLFFLLFILYLALQAYHRNRSTEYYYEKRWEN
jgi:hypothetical protein